MKDYLLSKGARLGTNWPYKMSTGDDSLDIYRLLYASFNGDLATIDILRQLGVNLQGKDYDGRTALHIAASEGKLRTVKYLA